MRKHLELSIYSGTVACYGLSRDNRECGHSEWLAGQTCKIVTLENGENVRNNRGFAVCEGNKYFFEMISR